MASLYDRGFPTTLDSATTGFNVVSNTDGDMTWVNGVSSMDGTTGYVNCVVDDTSTNNGSIGNFDLTTTNVFYHNQYIDLDTIAVGTTTEFFRIFKLWDHITSTKAPAELDVYNNGGTLALRLTGGADGDGATEQTVIYNIGANRPLWFEIRVDQAATNVSADGIVTLWLGGGDYPSGGQQVAQLTGIDNFDEFNASDQVRLGATNISASVSGQYQFDRPRGDNAAAILVVPNSAPTVSDPGTLYAGHEAYPVGTSVTVADTDSNLEFIQYTCESGKGTWNGTLGSSTVSAGALASNTVTITGANAALLATHATMTLTPASSAASIVTNACTITATDEVVASDAQNFNVVQSYGVITGTLAQVNATLAGILTVENATEQSCTMGVTATDSDSNTGYAECAMMFTDITVPNARGIIQNVVLRRRRQRN